MTDELLIKRSSLLSELTWQEAQTVAKSSPSLALLPVGALEQHGYHLPLGTDTIMVDWICKQAAENLPNVVVAPGIPYGTSENHDAFPGTVSVSLDTLKQTIIDIGQSIFSHGFDILLIVNGHGGNTQAVAAAAHQLRLHSGRVVAQLMWPGMVHEAWRCLEGDISWHADESETSLMLAIAPEKVYMERAVDEKPEPIPFFQFTEEALLSNKVDLGLPKTHMISSSGTIGLARLATPEKGKLITQEAIQNLKQTISALLENQQLLQAKLAGNTYDK